VTSAQQMPAKRYFPAETMQLSFKNGIGFTQDDASGFCSRSRRGRIMAQAKQWRLNAVRRSPGHRTRFWSSMTVCSSSPKLFSFPHEQELMTASHISRQGMLRAIAFASNGVAAPKAAS